jgi:hypothetical protein
MLNSLMCRSLVWNFGSDNEFGKYRYGQNFVHTARLNMALIGPIFLPVIIQTGRKIIENDEI